MAAEFRDRRHAGRRLGTALADLAGPGVVVLGVPRGGVPVAAEVAAALGAPLGVVHVRKLGLPWQPEVAMGAIGEGGVRLLDGDLIRRAGVTDEQVAVVEAQERATLQRNAEELGSVPAADLEGATAIIVDDGIATGATAAVACEVARAKGARRVVVAAPVASPEAARRIPGSDDVVCLVVPAAFSAVGTHYRDFEQTSTAEVRRLLGRARVPSPLDVIPLPAPDQGDAP